MELSFLQSGIDSLKKGFGSLVSYENLYYSDNKDSSRFFYLKDSILFIQHGIEILLKQVLSNESEYLLFSQLDDNVKKAYIEKNEKGLKSIFESNLKHKIHTVTFIEAIERVKMLPNIEFGKTLENKIRQLEIYRNIVMHSEPHINEIELNSTFDGLLDELDNFFYQTIGEKYNTISGYSLLVENYNLFQEILNKKNLEHKSKVVEIFLNSFKKAGISIGINEVKRITNIEIAQKLFRSLFDSDLTFGTDLYNGSCSGEVKQVERISETNFSMYAKDIDIHYEFKFKSIVLYVPELFSNYSPIIFFEIDDYKVDPELIDYVSESDKIETLRFYVGKSDGVKIYNPIEISEINYGDIDNYMKFEKHCQFLTGGLWGFMNVQNLDYNHNYTRFIFKNKFRLNGKQFEIILRKSMKEK
jgi:hypothetical protein